MVRVVPGVPDNDILEQTSVRPQYRGSRRVATLLSTSRHVSAKIQAFRLASRGAFFGTALRIAAKSVSIIGGATGGATGHRLCPPWYRFVFARGAPGKHPRTM